jgi:hypothetical protein
MVMRKCGFRSSRHEVVFKDESIAHKKMYDIMYHEKKKVMSVV